MATEVKMPQLGLTMEEGTITKWFKSEGDDVKIGEAIAEITTDKLTNEIESEVDGVILKLVAKVGEDIPVRGLLCVIGQPGETYEISEEKVESKPVSEEKEALAPIQEEKVEQVQGERRIKISPLARKTAEKLGTDFKNLVGSGPGGRIIQKDILEASEKQKDRRYI